MNLGLISAILELSLVSMRQTDSTFKETVAAEIGTVPGWARDYVPYQEQQENFVILKRDGGCIELCESGLPIPPKPLWYGYGETAEQYLAGANEDASKMLNTLANRVSI